MATVLRNRFEQLTGKTLEEHRVAAIRDWMKKNASIQSELRVSDAELAAHRIGMNEFVMLKTQARFAQTLRCLKEWTGGKISRSRVLDIGASDALMLKLLGCPEGVGVDLRLFWGRRMLYKGMQGVIATAEELPFRRGSFDYVLCFECLEHLENPIRALKQMRRIARRGIAFSIPWVRQTRVRQDNYDDSRNLPEGHHVFEFDDEDLRKVASHAGLRVVHHKAINIYALASFGLDRMVRRRMNLMLPSWSLYYAEPD